MRNSKEFSLRNFINADQDSKNEIFEKAIESDEVRNVALMWDNLSPEERKDLVGAVNPLDMAALLNRREILVLLWDRFSVEEKKESLNRYGNEIFCSAVIGGNPEILEFLFGKVTKEESREILSNLITEENISGEIPFLAAAKSGEFDMIQYLWEKFDEVQRTVILASMLTETIGEMESPFEAISTEGYHDMVDFFSQFFSEEQKQEANRIENRIKNRSQKNQPLFEIISAYNKAENKEFFTIPVGGRYTAMDYTQTLASFGLSEAVCYEDEGGMFFLLGTDQEKFELLIRNLQGVDKNIIDTEESSIEDNDLEISRSNRIGIKTNPRKLEMPSLFSEIQDFSDAKKEDQMRRNNEIIQGLNVLRQDIFESYSESGEKKRFSIDGYTSDPQAYNQILGFLGLEHVICVEEGAKIWIELNQDEAIFRQEFEKYSYEKKLVTERYEEMIKNLNPQIISKTNKDEKSYLWKRNRDEEIDYLDSKKPKIEISQAGEAKKRKRDESEEQEESSKKKPRLEGDNEAIKTENKENLVTNKGASPKLKKGIFEELETFPYEEPISISSSEPEENYGLENSEDEENLLYALELSRLGNQNNQRANLLPAASILSRLVIESGENRESLEKFSNDNFQRQNYGLEEKHRMQEFGMTNGLPNSWQGKIGQEPNSSKFPLARISKGTKQEEIGRKIKEGYERSVGGIEFTVGGKIHPSEYQEWFASHKFENVACYENNKDETVINLGEDKAEFDRMLNEERMKQQKDRMDR